MALMECFAWRTNTAVLGSLLLGALAVSAAGPDIAQDRIIRRNGNSLNNVRVVKDTWMEVVAKRGPIETRVPVYDVVDVRYATTPGKYYKGIRKAEQGDYALALKYLLWVEKNALNENTASMKQGLYYHIAEYYIAYRGQNSFQKARKYLEKLFAEVPDSRYLPDALLLYARSYYLEGDKFDKALKAYEDAERKLDAMANQIMDREHEIYLKQKSFLARYWKAQCLMMLKQYSAAKNEFASLAALASSNKAYKRTELLAKLGEARALWMQKFPDEAFDKFTKLVEEAEAAGIRDILAGAYAGLGDCYYQKGEFRLALWNYLRVVVQYFDASDFVPKALYRVGMCYLQMARSEGDKDAEAAARYYFTLASQSNDPFWAKEADKQLNSL